MSNTHNDVAHNWAHQTGRKTRGFNMYYDGETIYSYGRHFPLARFFTAPNGERVVLINTDSYSNSTSKHKTIVRRALGYDVNSRNVFVTDSGDIISYPSESNALRTIEKLREQNLKLAKTWARARSRKDWHANDIAANVSTINRLRELFALSIPAETMPGDIAAFVAEYAAAEKAREAAREAANREKILEWLNGAAINPPHTKTPYVRVRGDIVETSWGVKVPLRRARALYRLARICKACGHEYVPAKPQTIDHWQIDRISADGTIKAGCHILPLAIQRRAAELAGVR